MHDSAPDFEELERELAAGIDGAGSNCPTVELLLAHGQNVLTVEVEERVSQHLAECSTCRLLLEDLATLPVAELTSTESARIAARLPRHKPESSRWRILAGVAAGLVIAAGISVAFWHHAAPNQQAIVAPAAVPVQVAALEIPLRPLAAPNDPVMITRGSHEGANPPLAEMLPAFSAYNHGQYEVAARRFTALTKTYPESHLLWLYLGVSQLFLHQDAAAAQSLASARGAGTPGTVEWYSAIAAQHEHSADEKTLLQAVCGMPDSDYKTDSCRIAATLP